MAKWNVTLSTTEPYNYIGMINVRQGNRNTEVIEAVVVENGRPYDLTGCKVYFEAIVGKKYPVQLGAKVVDAKNGKIQYTFDRYSMQSTGRQTADFMIMKGTDVIGTTQDFSYFVVNAVSKTEGEMGSYWQSVEDLIADMAAFINENQGDFTDWMNARKKEFEKWREYQQTTFEAWRNGQETDYLTWFESIKDILRSIDPGGVMLSELMDARVDINGVRHESITKRLNADAEYLYIKLRETLYTLPYGHVEVVEILQDDAFSINHEVEFIKDVQSTISEGALVIATVDDPKQNVFKLVGVGEIK